MSTRIYVENLPAATIPRDLMNLFAPYGNIVDVNLSVQHNDPKPLGFGFVTMVTPEGARAAIQGLHGKQMATATRTLIVTEVLPPTHRSGTQESPKLPTQYHPPSPVLKKNTIIPTVPGPEDGKAK